MCGNFFKNTLKQHRMGTSWATRHVLPMVQVMSIVVDGLLYPFEFQYWIMCIFYLRYCYEYLRTLKDTQTMFPAVPGDSGQHCVHNYGRSQIRYVCYHFSHHFDRCIIKSCIIIVFIVKQKRLIFRIKWGMYITKVSQYTPPKLLYVHLWATVYEPM